MAVYKEITTTTSRKKRLNYQANFNNPNRVREIADEILKIGLRNYHDPKLEMLQNEMLSLKKTSLDKTPMDYWDNGAYDLINYSLNPIIFKTLQSLLNLYTGTILEAMCGHNSYFIEGTIQSHRTVVALDFCENSLERYVYPSRRRILCDLDQLDGTDTLQFFDTEHFDVVSICFGFKYPKNLAAVVKEFHRILKPNGILSFVENETYGYNAIAQRHFTPEELADIFVNAGYRNIEMDVFTIPNFESYGDFWHGYGMK